MELTPFIAARLKDDVLAGRLEDAAGLKRALRLLAVWRSKLIEREIVSRHGATIQNGPFAGMAFCSEAAEGCLAAKLLGCYESELHPFLLEVSDSAYDAIIDIGCAEGYYAVGLARRASSIRVYAHDINPVAQSSCRRIAALNNVLDRVEVGGEFRGADFGGFAGRRTLVIVDIEGGEEALLQPEVFPALQSMTVLVECHDVFKEGLCEIIASRFRPTHFVECVRQQILPPSLPGWFSKVNDLDKLLAMWEWRSGPTPWLIMRPHGNHVFDAGV